MPAVRASLSPGPVSRQGCPCLQRAPWGLEVGGSPSWEGLTAAPSLPAQTEIASCFSRILQLEQGRWAAAEAGLGLGFVLALGLRFELGLGLGPKPVEG